MSLEQVFVLPTAFIDITKGNFNASVLSGTKLALIWFFLPQTLSSTFRIRIRSTQLCGPLLLSPRLTADLRIERPPELAS